MFVSNEQSSRSLCPRTVGSLKAAELSGFVSKLGRVPETCQIVVAQKYAAGMSLLGMLAL